MLDSEVKKFEDMLDDYINHIQKNKNSLLARIYGIFTIETNYFVKMRVMIMQKTDRLLNKNN